jgi:hypothetical protein
MIEAAFFFFIALVILIASFYLADLSQKQNKDITYWGMFFISMFTSPITAYIILHFTQLKKPISELTIEEQKLKDIIKSKNENNAKKVLVFIIFAIIVSIILFIAIHQG